MIINRLQSDVVRYQKVTITAGLVFFLTVFTLEMMLLREVFSPWIFIPVFLGISLLEVAVQVPLIAKPFQVHHAIFMATLLGLGPSTAIVVATLVLGTGLVKTLFRCKSHVVLRVLQSVPALLSLWVVARIYEFAAPFGLEKKLGILVPALLVLAGYYLIYTCLAALSYSLLTAESFAREWKQSYLVSTLLVLSLSASVGLVSYFTHRLGGEVYLITIPFGLFVLTTYRIYTGNMSKSERSLSEHSQLQMSLIETLALAIDAKDHSTHGHVRRVQAYAVEIARSMGIEDPEDIRSLRTAALLHDIGKLAIPEYILSKPGKLTDAEYAKMVRHVEIGANILEPIHFPAPIVPIIRYHHERFDGKGYPYGLRGNEIPLGAKILAVADAFDALTSKRPYRSPLPIAEAIAAIQRDAETAFDPEVVQAFSIVAERLAERVSQMDTLKHSNNTHLPLSEPDCPEERKLWLRKKSFTEIASTNHEIYTLYEIFQTVGKSLNAEETMRIICTKLSSLVPFTSCVIYLKDRKTDSIYPAMVTGDFVEPLRKNWIGMGEGLTGYSVAFCQPVVNVDPSLDFRNILYLERPHQLVNSLIYPLKTDDGTFGALALYSSDRGKDVFSEDHLRVMETVVSLAAVSIQNALSFESYEENSLTDSLTGLPNSRFMFMAFEQNVTKAERFKETIAVLVMDLNSFKLINDRYGHKVGDEVLIKVAEILQKEMRKYDTCIRYAGDEFVAFLYNTDREMAGKIVERIKKSVSLLVIKVRSGKEVRLGVSVGMSMYPEDGVELNQLFTIADSQMYNDKCEGKPEVAPVEQAELAENISLEEDLKFQRIN